MIAVVLRWLGGLGVVALVVGLPSVYYRAAYDHGRRLREVTPGRFYRCGRLTADGFAAAVKKYGIRTVVNVENEFPDPSLPANYWGGQRETESAVCRRLGVNYVWLFADLIDPARVPAERPKVLDDWLKVLDDSASYPVLLHCKAGLHRTGVLTAVYRMEYEGWSKGAATRELAANGFGKNLHSANDYLTQYVDTYRPRSRGPAASEGRP